MALNEQNTMELKKNSLMKYSVAPIAEKVNLLGFLKGLPALIKKWMRKFFSVIPAKAGHEVKLFSAIQ